MSNAPLFVVFCESAINQVSFVQYVRASDAVAAMKAVEQPGVQPKQATVMPEGDSQVLDAINRTQLGLAAANDALREIRYRPILKHPYLTIIVCCLLSLVIWTVFWLVIALVLGLRIPGG